MVPLAVVPLAFQSITEKCSFSETVQTGSGYIRFYAKNAPSSDININLSLLLPSGNMIDSSVEYVLPTATASRLGGVKIGGGVDVQEDGTISVSAEGITKYVTDSLTAPSDTGKRKLIKFSTKINGITPLK